jgi:hypothetical protein
MTDETMLRAYYLDIEQELLARKAFPNCDQNQKRIPECERQLRELRKQLDEEIQAHKEGL